MLTGIKAWNKIHSRYASPVAGKTTHVPERGLDDKETCRLRLNANYPKLPPHAHYQPL